MNEKDYTFTFVGRESGFGENNNSCYYIDGNKLLLIDCGYTVFNKLIKMFDLKKYDIEVVITHLHPDHVGSLAQLCMYQKYVNNKKINIVTKAKNIYELLVISGVSEDCYNIIDDNIEFIKTDHTDFIDAYGFKINLNGRNIVYTGDTRIMEPYRSYLSNADEFYVDVSKNGGVHLKIDDIKDELHLMEKNGTKIILMHMDDKEYIKNAVEGYITLDF